MDRLTSRKYGEISFTGRIIPYSPYCSGCINKDCDCGIVEDMVKKLADYEDLEEQGRLIKLPIEYKKGDCRECVHTKTQCHHMEYKCSECPLTELFCDEFYLAIYHTCEASRNARKLSRHTLLHDICFPRL